MATAYVLTQSWPYEGHTVRGVFASVSDATIHTGSFLPLFEGEDYQGHDYWILYPSPDWAGYDDHSTVTVTRYVIGE